MEVSDSEKLKVARFRAISSTHHDVDSILRFVGKAFKQKEIFTDHIIFHKATYSLIGFVDLKIMRKCTSTRSGFIQAK
jgi:hypothetical protein